MNWPFLPVLSDSNIKKMKQERKSTVPLIVLPSGLFPPYLFLDDVSFIIRYAANDSFV